jgi:hypothetical protein
VRWLAVAICNRPYPRRSWRRRGGLSDAAPGEWNDDDFDVLADGAVVGRIMKAAAAPVGAPWLWTIPSYENRQPMHGYKVTREAAMGTFAKSWRRE